MLNFAAGPSQLPLEVKEKACAAIQKYPGLAVSILEANHRGRDFEIIYSELLENFNKVLALPDNYTFLLMPAGATLQFNAIPMNYGLADTNAIYALSGEWSQKALSCAKVITQVETISNTDLLNAETMERYAGDKPISYLHFTSNETIDGVEYPKTPKISANIPLISDMSSNIFSKNLDLNSYAMIYAGTQKNIGIAGLCLVIINKNFLEQSKAKIGNMPDLLNHYQQYLKESTLNTPNLFSWYLTSLMFEWIDQQGGLNYFEEINTYKSSLLYDFIDNSTLFINKVDPTWRSKMNVVCDLKDPALTEGFINAAAQQGILNVGGHRTRGGLRFSLYNAMPLESVQRLIEFMKAYEMKAGR